MNMVLSIDLYALCNEHDNMELSQTKTQEDFSIGIRIIEENKMRDQQKLSSYIFFHHENIHKFYFYEF